MRKALEITRVFVVSPELLLIVVGVVVQLTLAKPIERLLAETYVSDDLLKWAFAVPSALLCWSLVSGRKLLFPEKDKKSILQKWPDYWILKICFHVALAWNSIFVLISLYAWADDWKHPSSTHFIALAISIIGSTVCSFSIYNAQTRVEEEISQYVEKS